MRKAESQVIMVLSQILNRTDFTMQERYQAIEKELAKLPGNTDKIKTLFKEYGLLDKQDKPLPTLFTVHTVATLGHTSSPPTMTS